MMHSAFPIVEYKDTLNKNPFWSSYVCFAETIKGRKNLHSRTLNRWFNKLVDKDDYAKSDRGQILKFLFLLSRGVS